MYNNHKIAVIIAAAGKGTRLGAPVPKQYLKIGGEPVILKTLKAFESMDAVDHIYIVTNEQYVEHCTQIVKDNGIDKEEFEIAKRASYGDAISALNSTDHIANILADFDFSDRELYTYIDAIANATLKDIEDRLSDMMDADKSVLSVIK